MYDEFNPDSTIRPDVSLKLIHKNGSETLIPPGSVKLQAGAGFTVEEDQGEIAIGVVGEGISGDPYYLQKYQALCDMQEGDVISGPYPDPITGETPVGTAWEFTDETIYIASINGALPEDKSNTIFLSTDECSNLMYTDDHEFTLVDICGPCLDCAVYDTLQTYLERINEMIRYVWKLSGDTQTNSIPVAPDGTPLEFFTGIFVQAHTALDYWNYLVHQQSVKASAQCFGQSITAASYYKNISDVDANNVGIQTKFIFLRKDSGGNYFTWEGVSSQYMEVRVLDREGQPSAPLQGSPGFTTNTVTVDLDGGNIASGGEVYGDVALMITNADAFDQISEQVTVVVRTVITNTHIGNTITLNNIVYFRPPDPNGGGGSSS